MIYRFFIACCIVAALVYCLHDDPTNTAFWMGIAILNLIIERTR